MKMTTRSHRNLPHVVIVAFALAGALVASPASARESAIPRMLVGGRADLARTSALVAFLNDAGLKILAQASRAGDAGDDVPLASRSSSDRSSSTAPVATETSRAGASDRSEGKERGFIALWLAYRIFGSLGLFVLVFGAGVVLSSRPRP
ncbi:MAG TPA: hypothetical protein VK116_20335 [Planctomycetota bacterium]|nr:hypothetical protein [Planctomycetota bacterium]